MLFFHDAFHVLYHDDSVVHHNTDGQNQAQQSQHVKRETEYQHEAESSDKGDRYGYDGYQRGAPALQGEEDYENHQYQCLEERLVHFVNGFRNVSGHVERNLIFQSFRKVLADFVHGILYIFCHFHSIRSRQHVDTEYGGVAPVDTAFCVVRLGFERDAGYVAQADERTVGIGTQHDFLELADGREPPFGGDGDGDVQTFYGLLAEYARCGFTVLVF